MTVLRLSRQKRSAPAGADFFAPSAGMILRLPLDFPPGLCYYHLSIYYIFINS